MYFEHVLTDQVFLCEKETKLEEDAYRLDRMRGWLLLAFLPILFLMIYLGSGEGFSRYGNGYVYGFLIMLVGDIIFGIYRKKILKKSAQKISEELIDYQKLVPDFPKIGVTLNEASVSVSNNDTINTYPFEAIKKVVFSKGIILFIVKENETLFSIAIDDTREVYRRLQKKVKVRVFDMKSLKK